jgi:tetratricopeptide (TPR) repeat protein
MVYHEMGEHERALEEYEVALKLSKASSHPQFGEEGEMTANIISNMGGAHKKMKNYDKALELLKRGLELKEKAGVEKAVILVTFGLIASTYINMGRYSEAVEWHERCLAGREAELGKNHPLTLVSVYNLAVACKNAGDLDRAVELFERCLKADEEGGNEEYARDTAWELGKALKDGGAKFAAKLAALQQKYPNV